MTELWTIVAILAPWSVGTAGCRWARFRWGTAVALGWFVGQAVVMFGGYAAIALRGTEIIRPVAIALLMIGLSAMILHQRTHRPAPALNTIAPRIPWTRLELGLLVVVLASMAVKGAAGAASILWNPGRCEDALAYWLFKAKTVTLLGHIPFSPDHPFYLGGSNPKYPIYPSMIAAWIPNVMGEWHEVLSVIPWLITLLMLPIAAALILPVGTPRLTRIIAAYVVSSLPLAAIHVFRPGYVDLILASFLACGVGLLFVWRESARVGTLCLAMVMLIATACTKREGVMAVAAVLGVFTMYVAFERLRGLGTWKAMGKLVIATVLTIVPVYFLMDLSDLSSDAGRWAYHPEAWAALWRHTIEWSSFSFFFPLALATAAGLLVFNRSSNALLAIFLCVAFFTYAASPFLLTDNVRFALNDQTPSRLLLHIAPAIVVALAHGTRRGIACSALTN